MPLKRFLSPVYSPALITAAEAIALPLLVVVLCAWLNPADPLFVRSDFPWPWLAPLLVALRYGPMWGIASAGVLCAGWFVLEGQQGTHLLPKLNFLGGLVLTMLAGEFASIWQARLRRSEATQEYLDRRLDSLTRTHYLLRLSHESLEQDLLARPVSMRDALASLRELVAGIVPQSGHHLPAADKLLRLTVQFCQIERAAIVPLEDERFVTGGISRLGAEFPIEADDPLVRHALETGQMSHVASKAAERRKDSRYLIVAPVRDATGLPHALMLIENLPFLSLQEENLQVLNLMLGYYADSLALSPLVAPLQARWPDCPALFALELQRLTRLRRESGVPSAVIALIFPQGVAEDLPTGLLRQQRSLDVTWMLRSADNRERALLAILPLAPNAAVEGYLARIERWATTQYARDLTTLGIQNRFWHLGQDTPEELLARIMETCNGAA